MTIAVAYEQILAGSNATVSVEFQDQYGERSDASGAVTVTVTRSDGSAVITDATASHGATGIYTTTLNSTQTSDLDLLTAVWTDGADASKTTTIEVVGGYYFSLQEIRNAYPDFFSDEDDYPDDLLVSVRREVETECEKVAEIAFVPRFKVITIWGEGQDSLSVPDRMIRRLRAISFGNVSLSASALTNTVVTADGQIQRYWPILTNGTDDSWGAWGERFPFNTRVTIAYEHGYERPPADIKQAALERVKVRLTEPHLPLPANATTYTDSASGTFALSTPDGDDEDDWTTGIEAIDRVYRRYRARHGDLTAVPLGSVVRAGQWP